MTPSLEFFLTLIVAPLACSIIMLWINYQQKQFRQGWQLYENEKKKRREERSEEMKKWQREVSEKITFLSNEISGKVSIGDHRTVALKVDDYSERVVILEVKVKDIRNKIGTERERGD